jgi:16S rRNA (cytosine967-C5)-methyltransferase
MPRWLLERWQAHYGMAAAETMARAALEQPETVFNPDTGRIQDVGAQRIVPLLAIEPGMETLDLCAAPGNKTAQMLALGARVTACDRYFKRLEAVPREARRVLIDGARPLPFAPRFDRILLDAPCSGTGTLRRNPEIKWRLRPEDLERFSHLQRQLLAHALACLKTGGRLVYSTCSLEKEENEDVVASFASAFHVAETYLRRPGIDAGDGFFAAVITA